ncbi:MAG: antibiotic biosynthesis monooxygenase [Gammaproteobacteria bacterium]
MIQVTVEYVLRPGAEEKFEQALSRMQERVKGFDGYLGEELCQSTAEDGKFVTIFYWRDRETMATWRQDSEHLKVQQLGREEIFAWYRIRVAEVEREYGSDEPASGAELQ